MGELLLAAQEKMSWFVENKDLLLVLVGGICAAFGGFFGTLYLAGKARQIKMAETIGVQQVEAYKEALARITEICLLLLHGTVQEVIEFMTTHQQWFMNNVILLPHKFVENWVSIRSNLYTCANLDKAQARMTNEPERSTQIMEVLKLKKYAEKLGKEAMEALEKASGLRHPKIQRPPEEKQ
jgi:hypothetical protein